MAKRLIQAPPQLRFRYDRQRSLRRRLAHVSHKLARAYEWIPRLALEAPHITPEKMLRRLRARKERLIELLKEPATQRKKKLRQLAKLTRNSYSTIIREQPAPSAHVWSGPWPFWAFLPLPTQSQQSQCPSVVGMKTIDSFIDLHPYLDLQHDSYAEGLILHDPLATYYGRFPFRFTLYDDAGFWRTDDPDAASFASSVEWVLPAPECDSLVKVGVQFRVRGIFYNAADDGGSLKHTVAMFVTEPNGVFARASVLDAEVGLVDREDSGDYDSDLRGIARTFTTNAHISPHVALFVITHLSAQDGEVCTNGFWYINPEYGDKMWYEMTPL